MGLHRDYKIIKKSGLFDEEYYLRAYPDVRKADIDPLWHFVKYGWREGRNPSKDFDLNYYLTIYPDVKEAGINPVVHYVKWGIKEGRKTNKYDKKPHLTFKKIIKYDLFDFLENNFILIKKIISYIKKYGFKKFVNKVFQKMSIVNLSNKIGYELWIKKNEPDLIELKRQKKENFQYKPLISIVTPVWNTPERFLKDMIESVLNQTYSNWELCIADGNSTGNVKKILKNYANIDKRIKIKFLDENKGISENSNEAIMLAKGEYVTFLDHDDMLAPFALYEVARVINNNPDADLIYSDEDILSEDGKRRKDPHFKPDWSPDLLRCHNYITHMMIIKKKLLDEIGYFRKEFDGVQDYDLILRASEKARKILHIPKILYHWRESKFSVAANADSKNYAHERGKNVLREHLSRMGIEGNVIDGPFLFGYKVNYKIKFKPKVSIIIPNRDHCQDLMRCVTSILKSSYENFEIIVVENFSKEQQTFKLYDELIEKDKRIKIIKWEDKNFNFSKINNFAVDQSSGEVIIFLNNDTEVINKNWIEEMLEHCQRKEVGAVGAKLYYPDETIQHAGVILGIKGVAGHSHKYFHRNEQGFMRRLILIQNLSAVTAACMMVRKEVFKEVGGFDESYLLAFGDVDLCVKIREKGYFIVWTPYAELYHYESKTRGYEDTQEKQKRFQREIEYFLKKWKHILEKGDPYYSPNLTLDSEDFSIKID